MGDPLSVLREFVSSGRKWKEEGDEVVFGDVRFKKEEETAWRPANRQGTFSKACRDSCRGLNACIPPPFSSCPSSYSGLLNAAASLCP
jgi:hypothetical protein